MTTPTTSPTSITGAETTTRVMIASRATSSTSGPVITSLFLPRAASDRHLHDVFVGRNDLVAHGDDGIDRYLRLRHRGDHVDHVGLAARDRARLRIRIAADMVDLADRLLEHRGEARAAVAARRGGPAAERIVGGQPRDAGIGVGRADR